jgi:hypothetical protein
MRTAYPVAGVPGLQVEDALRDHSTNRQVAQGEQVSVQPSAPVHVGLRPDRAHDVHRHVLRNMPDGPAERVAAPLAADVKRIGDLGVPKPHAGPASGLDAEMDPARSVDPHHSAERGQAAGEIDILLPAVQRQALVEPQAMLTHWREAHGHVASVTRKRGMDVRRPPAGRCRVARQNLSSAGGSKTRAVDSVRKQQTGGDDDARIARHVLLDGGKIAGVWKEVVVEEHDDVGFHRRFDHGVALARQPWFGKQYDRTRIGVRGPLDIGGPRATHDHIVRAAMLARQFDQGLAQNDSPPDRWNTDRDVKRHPVFSPGESARRAIVQPVVAGPVVVKSVVVKSVAVKFGIVKFGVVAGGKAWHMSNNSNGISMAAIDNMAQVPCVVVGR